MPSEKIISPAPWGHCPRLHPGAEGTERDQELRALLARKMPHDEHCVWYQESSLLSTQARVARLYAESAGNNALVAAHASNPVPGNRSKADAALAIVRQISLSCARPLLSGLLIYHIFARPISCSSLSRMLAQSRPGARMTRGPGEPATI